MNVFARLRLVRVILVAGVALRALAWGAAAALTLVGLIAVAATLESVFAFCIGCTAFAGLMHVGLVPKETCAACANIALHKPQTA